MYDLHVDVNLQVLIAAKQDDFVETRWELGAMLKANIGHKRATKHVYFTHLLPHLLPLSVCFTCCRLTSPCGVRKERDSAQRARLSTLATKE